MYTIQPGKKRETWRPDCYPSYVCRTVTWLIVDPEGDALAETTTKAGALALVAILNTR